MIVLVLVPGRPVVCFRASSAEEAAFIAKTVSTGRTRAFVRVDLPRSRVDLH